MELAAIPAIHMIGWSKFLLVNCNSLIRHDDWQEPVHETPQHGANDLLATFVGSLCGFLSTYLTGRNRMAISNHLQEIWLCRGYTPY
jgi:hypothetical protein